MPMPTSSTASYNTNNQVSGTSLMLGAALQYDASGDVTEDNQNQYLYNGDGQLCAVKNLTTGAMTGYVYGADGTRVSTGTITTWGSCDPSVNGYQATKDSIAGPSGEQLTETGVDANGNVTWAHTNVWVGAALIATYDSSGLHFYLNDWAGSRRVQTDYEGVVQQTCASLPYGDGEICEPTPSEFLYAGLQRDSESGLDHAIYRQYSSTFGTWTTPDPYSGSYDWSNPQSLNRYSYVGGNPLAMTDPSGLDWEDDCFAVDVTIGCPLSVGSQLVSALTGAENLDTFLTSIPFVGNFLDSTPVGTLVGAGELFDQLFQSFGWIGGSPFHGNVAASQSGKDVPDVEAVNAPGPPSNVPNSGTNVFGVTPQQQKNCLNAWSNSAIGKGVQFFSLYNLATNFSSLKTWAEWTALPAAKIAALGALSKMSSAIGGTELSSVITGTTTTVTAAPVASGIATAESVGASVAPYGIATATILDMNASAGCMGMQLDTRGAVVF